MDIRCDALSMGDLVSFVASVAPSGHAFFQGRPGMNTYNFDHAASGPGHVAFSMSDETENRSLSTSARTQTCWLTARPDPVRPM